MASINNPFYLNLVSPTREEAAITVALLLNVYVYGSDEELNALGEAIGIRGEVRPLIESIGTKLDDNWSEMLKLANDLATE